MRTWQNSGEDNGSIHVLGNGQLIAYGRGPDLINLYGPPYSSPNILTLETEFDNSLVDEAERENSMAIWNHRLQSSGQPLLEFREFAVAGVPAYVRMFDCHSSGVRWVVRPNPAAEVVRYPPIPGSWLIILHPGQKIFNYPTIHWSFHWLMPVGNCMVDQRPGGELVVDFQPGKGWVAVVGSNEYPQGVVNVLKVLKDGADALLETTRRYWLDFTLQRVRARPNFARMPPQVIEMVDNVAVLLKAQQSADGGVMAGHYYPLAYIRDQYGTSRGMLSLGMFEEARQNLLFRFQKFLRFGTLQTAETMGTDCARHIHENDDVEGPAYTILQARDYLNNSSDHLFIRKLFQMLEWCWNVQSQHVVRGVLPFNGDETYVAGGFFPRSGLLQGSADTTLAYNEAGKWLVDWAQAEKIWDADHAARQITAASKSAVAYRREFFEDDRIWVNQPEREAWAPKPKFRHGVCQGGCGWFGWTEITRGGWYSCPRCLNKTDWQPFESPIRMEVNSVSLLPFYLGSTVLTREEMRIVLDHILKQEKENGHIPSVPGEPGCVGYDPGLLLYNLTVVGHPAAEKAYQRVMHLLDGAQAWNEYYDGADQVRKGCCRCRPWESAVNAEAVVKYINTEKSG